MSAVRAPDVLFRMSQTMLQRYNALMALGAARGPVAPLAYTFARATTKRPFRDRDGNAKWAAAGNLAMDWPTGLVDAAGNPIGGPLTNGARTQLVTDPENFGAWTVSGTPGLTSGQSDPFGGTAAYLVEDDTAGADEGVFQTVGFTGNGDKALSIFQKAGTATPTSLGLWSTATGWKHRVRINWTGGVPALVSVAGSGIVFPVESHGNGWYRICINAASVVAAETNQIFLRAEQVATVGTWYQFGANAWNAPFPSSYQGAGESAGVADALTTPVNFGPLSELTVLVRLARPLHADVSGALGVSPGIFSLGAGTAPRIGLYFDPAARNIISAIDTATTDATQSTAIPAGQPTICVQYQNLTTGGQTRLDVGSGFTALSSAATGFSAFSSQTLRVGRYDDELNGVVGDLIFARGSFTRAEMMALP